MVKTHVPFMAACAALVLFAGGRLWAEDHMHEEAKGPHGGEILEIGDKEDHHLELLHDEKLGKVTLYLLAKDMKTAVAIKDAPKLNLKGKNGNKQIDTKAVEAKEGSASQFEATDEALKEEPDGRIAITLADGKKHNVNLKHEHEHK